MTVPDLSRDLDSLPDGDVKAQLYALIRSIHDLEADVAVMKAALKEARRPAMCGVCCGTGKPTSGKPCICGGAGTEQAEMHGLRVALFEAHDEIERLSAMHAEKGS